LSKTRCPDDLGNFNSLLLPHPTPPPQKEDHKARRDTVKQSLLDILIREARLLDETVPTSFFESHLRKLSLRGAAKVSSSSSSSSSSSRRNSGSEEDGWWCGRGKGGKEKL